MGKMLKSDARPDFFAQGGTTKMFGKQAAGPQKPDTSAHDTSGDGGKFAKGGTTKMFGKGKAGKAEPGVSAKNSQ